MKASFTAVLAIAALAAASPQRPAGAPAGPLPTADPSLLAEFQSWTSQAGLSAFPTASSQWASVTAAHPLPTGLSSYASSLTNAWGTGTGAWAPGITQGPGGWHNGAGHGPFGGANGWGNGPWASNGDFTTGAWTSWWGNDACPASTWPGKFNALMLFLNDLSRSTTLYLRHLLTISPSFQAGLNLPGQPPLPGPHGPLAPPPPPRLMFTPPPCPTALFRPLPTSASALRRPPPTFTPVRLPGPPTLPVFLAALRESWVWSLELSFCERCNQLV